MIFQPFAICKFFRCQVFKVMKDALKDLLEILGAVASFSAYIAGAGFRIELNSNYTGAILAAVAHFLKKKLQSVYAVQGCTILFLVVLQRLK